MLCIHRSTWRGHVRARGAPRSGLRRKASSSAQPSTVRSMSVVVPRVSPRRHPRGTSIRGCFCSSSTSPLTRRPLPCSGTSHSWRSSPKSNARRSFRLAWQVSTSLGGDLAIDALEMRPTHARHTASTVGSIESDRGVQFVSIRYTEHLADAGSAGSVGSKGDSYDNALAESFNGLYKAELIHRRGPWKNADAVEWATPTTIDWFNNRRLHEEIAMLPPAKFKTAYYSRTPSVITTDTQTTKSL